MKWEWEGGKLNFKRGGKEWRLPGFSYADDLILCGESKEDLRVIVERFVGM